MDVRLHVARARNLIAKDKGGTSDPFVRAKLVHVSKRNQQKQATPVVLKSLNPVWEYDMDFSIDENDLANAALLVRVWDKDVVGKDFLGELVIPVKDLGRYDEATEKWHPLHTRDRKPANLGDISLRVGTVPVRVKSKVLAEAADGAAASLENLSVDDLRSVAGVLDLEILRCTNLPGNNGASLTFDCDPFVIVGFSTQTFRTRVISHSRNPVFNERVVLVVREGEKQFPLKLSVYDYDHVSKNDFIGSVDVTMADLVGNSVPTDISYELQLAKPPKEVHRAVIHVRSHFVPYDEVKRRFWVRLAELFDSDNNQRINLAEFTTLIDDLGSTMNDEQIEEVFRSYLAPGASELTFHDLVRCLNDLASDKNKQLLALERNPLTNKPLPKDEADAILQLALSAMVSPELVDQFVVGGLITEAYARKGWLSRAVNFVTRGAYDASKGNANILVRSRQDGRLHEEHMPSYVRLGIRLLYSTVTRKGLDQKAVRDIFVSQSIKQGQKFDDPSSAASIPSFIKFHNLNTDEILDPLDSFKTFNEFFYRKLKPGARTLASPDPTVMVSAADARTMVFPTIDDATRMWIKGTEFSLAKLFEDEAMAQRYQGGSLCIFRLAPQDYHRFHSPVDGVLGPMRPTSGTHLYTVNPMAVRGEVNVYTENKRLVCEIDTDHFGKVALVIIGAMMVGSINITAKTNARIARMDELGYFAFGGSTVIMVTEKDRITFDADLLDNSSKQIETLLRVGDSLARKK